MNYELQMELDKLQLEANYAYWKIKFIESVNDGSYVTGLPLKQRHKQLLRLGFPKISTTIDPVPSYSYAEYIRFGDLTVDSIQKLKNDYDNSQEQIRKLAN